MLNDGAVAVVESMASRVTRITREGEVLPLAYAGDAPNGMASDGHGGLIVANNGGIGHSVKRPGRLQRIDPLGSVHDLVSGLDAPNDVCATLDGAVWFTDPRVSWFDHRSSSGRVYRWRDGDLTIDHEGFDFPNGIGWALDGALVVAESRTGALHRRSTDGWEVWTRLKGAPDGFAFDAEGRCFVCCFDTATIEVVDTEGQIADTIRLDETAMPTNCAIAPDGALVVTESASGQLLALPLGLKPAPTLGPAAAPHRARQAT